ncbi:MAG: hypothetical protein ACLUH9_11190 [Waltera sp.]
MKAGRKSLVIFYRTPAFMFLDEKGKQSEYYFKFDTDRINIVIAEDGQGSWTGRDVSVAEDGYAQITKHLFDRCLIAENHQASAVSLYPDKSLTT